MTRFYAWSAPALEHPRRTLRVFQVDHVTGVLTAPPYTNFTVQNKNMFIDLPLLIALALCSPGVSWWSRWSILLLGCLFLFMTHFAGFASALHLAYVQDDLVHRGVQPSFVSLNLIAPLRRLIYSDLALAFPFFAWGTLYAWQAGRTAGPAKSLARPNKRRADSTARR